MSKTAKLMLGDPEIEKLAKGETLTIRLREGTTELEITASAIAKGRLNPPKNESMEFLRNLGVIR